MAIRIPIITDLQDKGIKEARRQFAKFKADIAAADGTMGKFKAGSKAAFDGVKAQAGNLAIVAGAAIAGFAVKAIGQFQDLALAAGKFSDATGLAVEDASRYLEVAGDLSIPVDAVEGAIGRLNKTIGADPDKVRNLGVDLVYLNDGTLDVNKTFLNTIDRLKKIKDPAEKARVAAQLLGKGWQSMAELIEMGADDLKASLDSVSGAQVISDEELEKAKEYRETVQDLGDLWNSFVIGAGGVFVDIANDLRELTSGWEGFGNQLRQGPLGTVLGEVSGWFNDNEENAKKAEEAAKSLGDAYAGYVSSRLADSREKVYLLNLELEDQADLVAKTDAKWQALKGTLRLESAVADAKAMLDQLKEKAVEAFNGADDALGQYEQGLIDAKLLVLSLAESVTLTNSQKNQIRVLVDTGDLERAIGLINTIGAGGYTPELNAMRYRGARAAGGPVAGGGSYLVGERGPELFTPGTSGNITPNNALGGGGITVNVNGGDPNSIVRALQQYVRDRGALPFAVNSSAFRG
jgi:hypothetical protein